MNVLPAGTHLGEFEIKGLIGEGGFGIVYLAYDHSLERQVALKEYMPSGLATRTTNMAVSVRSQKKLDTFTAGLKSFINEARMLAQFDSPALVKVHSFWEGNGTAYMVMPYYEGITLKQALQTHKIKPTEGWIRMLLADLCEAIDILHRAHCLHRDIAPDNILLLKDGRPLLLDFGAARRVIGDLTQCFTAILKPGFAPIEQYADIAGLRQGAWTDIYALAAVVYYLITGKAPPPSVARMVHDELVPAREAGKGRYSESFLATIDKALSVRPEQRYHSIDELRHALNIMEPEPRTVPYPGGEWTTTVARTVPVAPPGENMPAAHAAPPGAGKPAVPNREADDLTRHVPPSADGADDVTAIAPPARPPERPAASHAASHIGAAPREHTAFAGSPDKLQAANPVRADKKMSAPAEPELPGVTQQMAEDWHQAQNPSMPPHRHEGDAAIPRKRDKQGWLILALLFAAGIGSGIYLGTNHSWDGLTEHDMESAQSSPKAPAPPQDQSLAAAPPSTAAPATSGGMASSGSSESSSAAGTPGSLGAPDDAQASLSRLRSEIETWKAASKNNQISGYERYLREYPHGLYAAIAKLRLERLYAAASPKPAEKEAKPAEPEAKLAEAGKAEPAPPPARKTKPEEAAWDKATSVNTAAAYQEYLRKYPKGGYAALARDRLASMKLAANRHSAAPPLQPEVRLPAGPSASSGAGTASSSGSDAPKTAASAPLASQPAASAPATASPPQAAAPAKPNEPAAKEQAATSTTQASIKPQDSEAPSDTASAAPGRAIKFADQTMIGDFTVDKKTGLVSGKGKISWSNGNQFEGTLVQGSKEGKGKFVWSSGQRYSGDWAHDAPNGRGIFIFPDGSRYEGEVKDGYPQGQGTTRFKNGVVYSGDWVRGKIHGHGRYTWADGSYWEGEFRNDKKTENGKMYYPNKSAPRTGSATPPSSGNEPQHAAAGSGKESEE